jgi:hypothetical protein
MEDAMSREADSMPDELYDELDAAYLRWDELAERGRSLRFSLRAPAGVAVDVCDARGRSLGEIDALQAVAVACGAPLEDPDSSPGRSGRSPEAQSFVQP